MFPQGVIVEGVAADRAEETTTDALGRYRLRGLAPGMQLRQLCVFLGFFSESPQNFSRGLAFFLLFVVIDDDFC